ncbi:MAG: prepilin peptidase [Anaerolineae bacterium]|nr:prepilin peptidase [Anaerolineae bacterium]
MTLLYALLGLLVGAFLNVCADNLPLRRRLQPPQCTYCAQVRDPLSWVTVIGYLVGRTRCRHCAAPWPLRHVLVELVTSVSFAFLWRRYGPTAQLLPASFYICVFLLITVTDLEHRLVLNVVVLPAILFALACSPLFPGLGWKSSLLGGIVGFALFYLIARLYPGGMGWGDVKLAAFVGVTSGFPEVIVALVVGILVGGIVALLLLFTRRAGLKSGIPYGPFLVVGGLVGFFYGPEIVAWYLQAYR